MGQPTLDPGSGQMLAVFNPEMPRDLLAELGSAPEPSPISVTPRMMRKQLLDQLTLEQAPHLIAAAKKQRRIYDLAVAELTRRVENPEELGNMDTSLVLKIVAMADKHLAGISAALMREKTQSSEAVSLAMILAMTHAIHGSRDPAPQSRTPDIGINAQDATE